MADWEISYGDHSVGPEFPLTPTDQGSLTLTFYLTGQPHEMTVTVDGRAPEHQALAEYVDDGWAYRNGQLLFRGPLGAPQDSLDEDSHTAALTFHSYRERLAHLYVPASYAPPTANAPTLAGNLVTVMCAGTDLASIVTDAHYSVGSAITTTIQTGQDAATTVDSLAQVQTFEWDMIPQTTDDTVRFQTWPSRGRATLDAVLDYGGAVTRVQRALDLYPFANEVWVTGTDPSGNSVTAVASLAYGAEGRWVTIGDGGDLASTQLQARANTLVQQDSDPTPSYTLTLAPDWWQGPSQLWLGDSPTIAFQSGRLSVVEKARVQQMQIVVADGVETVTATLGVKPAIGAGTSAAERLGRAVGVNFQMMNRRLQRVERRQ